jgi:dopamine beta-monooxygenase
MKVRAVSSICILLLVLLQPTAAWENYLSLLPNGYFVKRNGVSWLGVGHDNVEGGGDLNQFGKDFEDAHFQWTRDLCLKDSDGDGVHNGAELGDPQCVWRLGLRPARFQDLSHPGFADSVPVKPFAEATHDEL